MNHSRAKYNNISILCFFVLVYTKLYRFISKVDSKNDNCYNQINFDVAIPCYFEVFTHL